MPQLYARPLATGDTLAVFSPSSAATARRADAHRLRQPGDIADQ